MESFTQLSRLVNTINQEHKLIHNKPLHESDKVMSLTRSKVRNAENCSASDAVYEYAHAADTLRTLAAKAGVSNPLILEGAAERLLLIDVDAKVAPSTSLLLNVVEHLKLYLADVEIMRRAQGDKFDLQRHFDDPIYDTLRSKIFDVLFNNTVWVEQSAMVLYVNGFAFTKVANNVVHLKSTAGFVTVKLNQYLDNIYATLRTAQNSITNH